MNIAASVPALPDGARAPWDLKFTWGEDWPGGAPPPPRLRPRGARRAVSTQQKVSELSVGTARATGNR